MVKSNDLIVWRALWQTTLIDSLEDKKRNGRYEARLLEGYPDGWSAVGVTFVTD